jgi:hypothetical protein
VRTTTRFHPTSRTSRRASIGALLAAAASVLATTLVTTALLPTRATGDEVFPPRPLFWEQPLADPAVVTDGGRWFAAGTGWRGGTRSSTHEHGAWQAGMPLLGKRPAWASNGDVWAPDVERRPGGGWLAYYAIPVPGLPDAQGRCIGVATSPALSVPFTPIDTAPLACPARAATPAAADQVPRERGLPSRGVIDPSSYVAPDGRRFLLYRTQGTPSSIRMVRLRRSGLTTIGRSVELLRDRGILENPVMVDRGGWHHLVMSRGDYGRCSYSTVWRRETSLRKRWQKAEQHVLVDRATSGICGPGGADYVEASPGRANRLFLHGWVCDGTNGPCPPGYSERADVLGAGRRAMYVARLGWTRSGPRLAQFGQGPWWTPPPSPVPTPVPTTPVPTTPVPTTPVPTTPTSPVPTTTLPPTPAG